MSPGSAAVVTAAGALYTLADLMPIAERQSLLEAELVMAVVPPTVPVVVAVMPPPLASPVAAPVAVAMAAVLVVLVSMRVMVSTDVLLS